MTNNLTLGVDLGGTNIKAVLMNREGQVLEETSIRTGDAESPDSFAIWKLRIKDLLAEFQRKTDGAVKRVGIAAAGLANPMNTAISYLPNKLIGLENFIWKDFLDINTWVLNDAHAALVAESRVGAGYGYQNIILLTLGTGIGGGIMVDGKLLQGQQGRAGHLGHITVSDHPGLSIVNAPGSLENAIGEGSIEQRTYGKYQNTKDLVDCYRKGDTFATYVWLESVKHLATAISSLINALSPEIVILSGGITQAGDALAGPLRDFLQVYEWRPAGFQTPVTSAYLGTHAGAVGAGFFAIERDV